MTPTVDASGERDLREPLGLGGARGNGGQHLVGEGSKVIVDLDQGIMSTGDARILVVDYDDQDERYKAWRSVVGESSAQLYRRSPIDGPVTSVNLAKHWLRHGGDGKMWFAMWCREKHISGADRTLHEMTTLSDAYHIGGTYDCLNVGGCVIFECLARRLQSLMDAYEDTVKKQTGSGPTSTLERGRPSTPSTQT